ncbi:MAG: hypothetical protein ACREK2_09755 [Gemmatimonadota bacterium]
MTDRDPPDTLEAQACFQDQNAEWVNRNAMDRRGFTVIEIILVGVLLALIITAIVALCSRSGPLTAQDGRDVADGIHGQLETLIGTTTTPVDSIAAEIRRQLLDQAGNVQGREGATDFIDGLCEQLRTLIQNRIRSAPGTVESNRLREFLPHLAEMCQEARARAAGP